MYTEVNGKYVGNDFGSLISSAGLSANLFRQGARAFKVFNLHTEKGEVFREAYAMAVAEKLALPAARVHQVTQFQGHWVLEMDFIDGPVMLERIIDAAHTRDMDALDRELGALAELHCRIHSVHTSDLPSFKGFVGQSIREKKSLPPWQRDRLLDYMEALPDGDQVVHGDYHPINVIYGENGPAVIDWATAGSGTAACDVARTYLNLSYPPIPELQAPGLDIGERYFRQYSARSGLEFQKIAEWFPVVAALSIGRDPVFSAHMRQYLPNPAAELNDDDAD